MSCFKTRINIVGSDNGFKGIGKDTRDLAQRINGKYGENTFTVPEGRYMKSGARIMGLDDPTSKMSKSAQNEYSRISLLDTPNKIKKAVMRATTDSDSLIKYDVENKPGISNLLSIYSAFTGKSIDSLEKDFEGSGYGDFKKALVDELQKAIAPIQKRYEEIRYSDELIKILKDGAEHADAIAQSTLKRVKENFGLGLKF